MSALSVEHLPFEENFAILAGAGVSLDPPSNLLDGKSFMLSVLNEATPSDIPLNQLHEGLDLPKAEHYRPGELVRFELLMKGLQDSGLDPELRVLDCLGECEAPNENHFMLAQLLHGGCTVLTTNFDTLIEEAYQQLNPGCWPSLRVAIYDRDFEGVELGPSAPPTLWTLHGSLRRNGYDTRDSVGATMPKVLSGTQRGPEYQLLRDVLRTLDLVVVGYSGWDDFDIIPVLASTFSERRLFWINHDERSDRPRVLSQEEVRGSMHAEWEEDTVGRDRVFFNHDVDGKEVRRPDTLWMIRGLTVKILRMICTQQQLVMSHPNSSKVYRFGKKYPDQVNDFFRRWAANLSSGAYARYHFIASAFELHLRYRAPDLEQHLENRLSNEGVSPAAPALERLNFLLRSYNDGVAAGHYSLPIPMRNQRQLEQLAGELQTLLPDLNVTGKILAWRLLGHIACLIRGAKEGGQCFERSIDLARGSGDLAGELVTSLAWYDYLQQGLPEDFDSDPIPYSLRPAWDVDFSRLLLMGELRERITLLEDETGYLPLVSQHELGEDFLAKLESLGPQKILPRVLRARRHSVDVGDLRGEAQFSLRLAHVWAALGNQQRTAIELLRVEELANLLGQPAPEATYPDSLGVWDIRRDSEEIHNLRNRVQKSMWP